jgi:AcrR family transcriptional regulator
MAHERVRISSPPATAPATLRRRPQQSRARASSEALQDAFVRVLLDRGYEAMTVRELAGVAGVGIGTFYDYVSDKQALAALTIHRRVRAVGQQLVSTALAHAGLPLARLVPLLVEQQIDTMRGDVRAWAALYQLEREISSPEAYRKNYRRYVEAWASALAQAGDAPQAEELARLARAVHVLTYGAVFQALLTLGVRTDWAQLRADLGRSLTGHLLFLS